MDGPSTPNTEGPSPMNLSQIALDYAASTARTRWRRNRRPDSFKTLVTVRDQDATHRVRVQISHRETFPLGGRTYNLRIVDPRREEHEDGHLLHTGRINLAVDEVNT